MTKRSRIPATLSAADLYLVSCVAQKQPHPVPAKDLYRSALFVKARRVVEAYGRRWFILSAEHGLVHPDMEIAPYDKTLNMMGSCERRAWAARVLEVLTPRLAGVKSVVVFAGKKYREFLVPELRRRGIGVHVPMEGLLIGEQLAWLARHHRMKKKPISDRIADTVRFYKLLKQIETGVGGRRRLAECTSRMDWPQRGVYFFFEAGELRGTSGSGDRIVRVGSHALKRGARTTLWKRLRSHRGIVKSGGGSHRGSIFRGLVGRALACRGDCPLPPSWKVGGSHGAAELRLRLGSSAAAKDAEAELERRVSDYIRQMPFLWLNVPDAPGPKSVRGYIERNAIALLSGYVSMAAADRPSPDWLGSHSDRPKVRASGLWNNNHVDEDYDPAFLNKMAELIKDWRL